jgi:hypothetical protein
LKGFTVPRKKRNRSQAIRDYLATDPAAGPAKIVAEMKKQGITISSALASRVKSRLNNPTGKRRRGRRGRPRLNQNGRRAAADDLVNVDSLIQARAFADKVGGIDEASRLLRTLARLG